MTLWPNGNMCAVLRHSVMSNSVTLWTVAHQAPLSIGLLSQEYWSGSPCPPPDDVPDPGIKPRSPTLQVDSLPSEPPGKPSSSSKLCTYYDLIWRLPPPPLLRNYELFFTHTSGWSGSCEAPQYFSRLIRVPKYNISTFNKEWRGVHKNSRLTFFPSMPKKGNEFNK